MTIHDTYRINPARYAKDRMTIHCIPDGTGWKTLAALIISNEMNARYSHREHAYIVSASKARKFVERMAQIEKERSEKSA